MLSIASQLGQLRPSVTTPVTAYPATLETEVTLIVICNTTGVAATFSIYHDDNGTTYTSDTALYSSAAIAANETVRVELQTSGAGISVNRGGSIAVQSDTANALTFSLYGVTTRITGPV